MQWWVTGNGSPGSYVVYQAVGGRAGDTRGPFPNKAEAEATAGTLNKNAKLGVTGAAASGATAAAASAAKAAKNALGNVLGLPTLSNLRDFVVRAAKVVIGALLIIVGVNSLLKSQGIDVPKPPAVIPV